MLRRLLSVLSATSDVPRSRSDAQFAVLRPVFALLYNQAFDGALARQLRWGLHLAPHSSRIHETVIARLAGVPCSKKRSGSFSRGRIPGPTPGWTLCCPGLFCPSPIGR